MLAFQLPHARKGSVQGELRRVSSVDAPDKGPRHDARGLLADVARRELLDRLLPRHPPRQERLGENSRAALGRDRGEAEQGAGPAGEPVQRSSRIHVPARGVGRGVGAFAREAQVLDEGLGRPRACLEGIGGPFHEESIVARRADASARARSRFEHLERQVHAPARRVALQRVRDGEPGESRSENRDPHRIDPGFTTPAPPARAAWPPPDPPARRGRAENRSATARAGSS